MLFAICSYCKGYGHYKSHCLKLITKSPNTDICRDYNRSKKSQCQTETEHFCLSVREHRCSICSKSDCKAYLHIHDNYQHWPNTEMESQHTQLRRLIKTLEAEILTFRQDLEKLKNDIGKETTSRSLGNIVKVQDKDLQPTTPSNLEITNNTFLAIPVTSAGQTLSLAMSTGFPLSSISEKHAKQVLKFNENRSHMDLSSSSIQNFSSHDIRLITADSESLLLKGPIQVPITFSNGKQYKF